MNAIWVFIGGGAGSVLRYWFGIWLRPYTDYFPWATMAVNLLSCLILGALAALVAGKPQWPLSIRLLLITGFCGGFSTFSTFSLEIWELLQLQQYRTALLYLLSSLALGLAGILTGWALFYVKPQ